MGRKWLIKKSHNRTEPRYFSVKRHRSCTAVCIGGPNRHGGALNTVRSLLTRADHKISPDGLIFVPFSFRTRGANLVEIARRRRDPCFFYARATVASKFRRSNAALKTSLKTDK